MVSTFLRKFKRITYSTYYIPEIDGLRFLALFSVIAICHIPHYFDEYFYQGQLIKSRYWNSFIIEGTTGVSLFFAISGFILSLPFARWRFNHENKISLRKYYLRRITRLEPPYFILLIILFIVQIFIIERYSFKQLFPSFVSSLFYVHTIVYQQFPLVLPLAWSLEVEVQFYILAPVFCMVFMIHKAFVRRILILAIMIINILTCFGTHQMANVFICIHLFGIGIILADMYAHNQVLFKNKMLGLIMGVLALTGYLFIISLNSMGAYFLKMVCIFILMHTILTNPYMRKPFSYAILTIIGGMCYSIYLLHFAIISFIGKILLRSGEYVTNKGYFIPLYILFIIIILLISSLYFLFIEKPFMKPKWLGLKKESGHKHV